MKSTRLASSVLAVSLALGTPSVVFAHVGHGDEFQAEGGIDRVKVNAETDALMGIEITEIAPAADGSAGIYIPMTTIVEDGDRKLVFVHYGDFYEPVPVTMGETKGELVEVTEGLSIGEHLVTQGSLSLYAESRKTQTAEAEAEPEPKDSLAEALIGEEATEEVAEETTSESAEPTAIAPESAATETVAANTNAGFPVVGGAIGAVVAVVLGALGIRAYNMNRQGKNFFGK
jgi:cation efflux system membrane fusion protein